MIRLYTLTVCFVLAAIAHVHGQTNTIQLRNGSHSTTILPSSSSTVSVQIPSLTSGTHYLLTSTTNPGSSGAAGSFISYGATSAQNSSLISATNYLFNVSYASDGVEQNALGGLITATATGTNTSATALTLSATGTGSGTSDALYISNGRLKFLESTGGTYFTTFKAGDQSANINYTLPTADGTSGQALITNGSGVLSWGAAGATNLDGLSDAKVQGDDFTGSMILGHQATGTPLSAAIYNTAVGIGAMDEITQGDYNTALGSSALTKVTTGSYNIAVGSDALVKVNTGSYNVSLGSSAGREITTGTYNVSVGHQAGNGITTGVDNIAIGYGAFYFTTTGSNNVGVGRYTMNAGPTGSYNVAVGSDALRFTTGADHNVAIGNEAGYAINTGDYNSLLGYRAGYSLKTGSSNVFIGYTAGSNTASDASDLLYIDNTNTNSPLIYGDFSANTLTFNGATTTTGTSAINGVVSIGGTTAAAGEIRLLEDLDDGSHYTAFKAQAQAANVTYTLPASDGTNGQALTTNGSGTLSWSAIATSIDGLSDAKSGGTGFVNSLILGHQTTGTLVSSDGAEYNTAVGYESLKSITKGNGNTAVGYSALSAATIGEDNIAIGFNVLASLTSGGNNIAIGTRAGQFVSTASENTIIGWQDTPSFGAVLGAGNTAVGAYGQNDAEGSYNVTVGWQSGFTLTSTSEKNVGIGYANYRNATTGDNNIAIGTSALYTGGSGSDNIGIGRDVLADLTTASNNVAIGYNTGNSLKTGSYNVFIGNNVGSNTASDASNLLYIDNSNTNSPLIYGNFSTDQLTLNGHVEVAVGTTTSTVPFSILGTGIQGAANVENAFLGTDVPTLFVRNTTNSADADAVILAGVGGSSAGDAYIGFDVKDVGGWSIGVDNSDIDKLKFLDSWNFRSDGGTPAYGLPVMTMTRLTRHVGIGTENPAYKLDVVGDINASANVRAAGSALTSDARLKRNIQPLANALDVVQQLRPVSYEKRADLKSNDYSMKQMGFIAQELEKVLPNSVHTDKSADAIKSVDYISIIPVLTKALQEQQALIAKQQQEIDELKKMVKRMSVR